MIENWGFCNLTGLTRMIGFKAGLFNCRVAAYLNQAMECFRRANIGGQPFEIATSYRRQAVKLVRSFTALAEAFKRYRSGGQQKVIVEHVHVNQGGQAAIVGSLTQGGGGDEKK